MSADWARLYESTYADLLRFLMSKVWDEERARDLVQETFVRALEHQPDNPRAWLFSVAANLARDEARTAIRRKRHLTLLKSEEEARASVSNRSDPAEKEERREGVRQALGHLSERDREALLLWNAGLSYSEIAEQTGLSPGAIGTTLARARKRLVEEYDAMETDRVARN